MSERSNAAQSILAIPLFYDLIGELETAAVNAAVAANYDDDKGRQANLAQVRAIRQLKSRIEAIAREGLEKQTNRAPA